MFFSPHSSCDLPLSKFFLQILESGAFCFRFSKKLLLLLLLFFFFCQKTPSLRVGGDLCSHANNQASKTATTIQKCMSSTLHILPKVSYPQHMRTKVSIPHSPGSQGLQQVFCSHKTPCSPASSSWGTTQEVRGAVGATPKVATEML